MYARINTAFGNAVPLPAELSTESGQKKNTICEFFSFFFFLLLLLLLGLFNIQLGETCGLFPARLISFLAVCYTATSQFRDFILTDRLVCPEIAHNIEQRTRTRQQIIQMIFRMI